MKLGKTGPLLKNKGLKKFHHYNFLSISLFVIISICKYPVIQPMAAMVFIIKYLSISLIEFLKNYGHCALSVSECCLVSRLFSHYTQRTAGRFLMIQRAMLVSSYSPFLEVLLKKAVSDVCKNKILPFYAF